MSEEMIKTILVSGASGFLGKELVQQLLQFENNKVIAITSQKENLERKFGKHSNLEVLDTENWTEILAKQEKIDILVNCAFPRSADPASLAKGLDFTEKLVKEAIGLNIKNIINISSQSVYSQKAKSLPDEFAEVAPQSLYGMAKYAGEKVVASLCEESALKENLRYSNIRLASLTGINLDVRMTNKFVIGALKGEKLIVNGSGQKVSYLDVRDAASALIAMLKKDSNSWKKVYNLGSTYYSSVLEIAQTVKELGGKNFNTNVDIEVLEREDNFNNLINSELFYRDFEWSPYYDVKKMVEDLFIQYTNLK